MTPRTLSLMAVAAVSLAGPAMARSPEPSYTLLDKDQAASIEVRRYPAMVHAVTLIEASDYGVAGNLGFQRLAGYIFGNNGRDENIGMTSPVVRSPTIGREGPALAARSGARGWRMAFIMPSRYTLETLPAPRDARVSLVPISERHVVTLSFSGRASDRDLAKLGPQILAWAKKKGLVARGAPTLAVYDSPRVPGPLRRNEIMLEIEPPKP